MTPVSRITNCAALVVTLAFSLSTRAAPASEDVRFESGEVTLAGSVILPSEDTPVAAVVYIHGAGPVQRKTPLATRLAEDGIAVLTYDKRGVGQSGGAYEDLDNVSAANLDLLAKDAARAFETLKRHPRVRGIPIGYVGFSQAGWIVPLAAARTSPAFIGLWSGPVCTVSEELHFSALAENDADFWKKHTSAEIGEYMKSVRYRKDDVDPSDTLARIPVPGLWLFGGDDNSIPVQLSIARLNALIERGQPFQYKLIAGEGHYLLDSATQQSYRHMVEWIRSVAAGSSHVPGGTDP